MQLAVPASKIGIVGFVPPAGTFPTAFSFAAAVNLLQAPAGCVLFDTVGSRGTVYTYIV
jgi:hypothetical protein